MLVGGFDLLDWAGDDERDRELLAYCRDMGLLDDYQEEAGRSLARRDWEKLDELHLDTTQPEADRELSAFLKGY